MPAATAAKAAPKTVRPQLHPSRFSLAEHKRNVYFITPADGTTLADVLDPLYWSHVATRLRPTDRVEVHAEDGSWFAELYVREAAHMHASLVALRTVAFKQQIPPAPGTGHAVAWKGPHHRWAVVRLADGQLVKSECASREDATLWLAANARTLNANTLTV